MGLEGLPVPLPAQFTLVFAPAPAVAAVALTKHLQQIMAGLMACLLGDERPRK